MTDSAEILRRARRGDTVALGQLLAQHQQALLAQARRRMGGLEGKLRPSDILQSTFVDAVKFVDSLKEETDAGVFAWLAQILDNNIRDRRRYFHAQKRGATFAPESVEDAKDGGASPEQAAVAEERRQSLVTALDELPDRYRAVLQMRRELGFDNAQIAERLGITEAATRTLICRARQRLLESLGEEHGAEP